MPDKSFLFRMSLSLVALLSGCIGGMPMLPAGPILPADYQFDNPQMMLIYGKVNPKQSGNLHIINPHLPEVNYTLRGSESGYFFMEIEPGFFQIRPAHRELKFVKQGLTAQGYSATGRIEIPLEEDEGGVAASIRGEPGSMLYIGSVYMRQEFVETRDEKEQADFWMAKRYPGFKPEKAIKYLAK